MKNIMTRKSSLLSVINQKSKKYGDLFFLPDNEEDKQEFTTGTVLFLGSLTLFPVAYQIITSIL